MADDPDAGRPPRADPGSPQPADRQGRRRLLKTWPRRGTVGPLVSRSARPGDSRNARARSFTELLTAKLFGDLDLERSGKMPGLALPPYFPADRNEAYIAIGAAGSAGVAAFEVDLGSGLAAPSHRSPAVPVSKILPELAAPTAPGG